MLRTMPLLLALSLSTAVAQTQIGSWTLIPRVDKLTDQNTSIAYSDGLEDADTSLYLKCMDDGLNIYFDPDDYLDTDPNSMYWRFDKNPFFGPFEYDPGTEGDVAFLPMNLVPRFLANAKQAKQVVIRALDYHGSSHTYTFNFGGIADVVRKLNCK